MPGSNNLVDLTMTSVLQDTCLANESWSGWLNIYCLHLAESNMRGNYIQSTLSKADILRTKATVRFREVSALERVQLQRYKCNSAGSGPNLLSGLESVRLERVDCICFALMFHACDHHSTVQSSCLTGRSPVPYPSYPPNVGSNPPYPGASQPYRPPSFPTPPATSSPTTAANAYRPPAQPVPPGPAVTASAASVATKSARPLSSQSSISEDMIKSSLVSAVEDKLRRQIRATFEQAQVWFCVRLFFRMSQYFVLFSKSFPLSFLQPSFFPFLTRSPPSLLSFPWFFVSLFSTWFLPSLLRSCLVPFLCWFLLQNSNTHLKRNQRSVS